MIDTRKIILIDLDETLVNMLYPWVDAYNKLTKEDVQINTMTSYNIKQYVKNPKLLYTIIEQKGFFYHLDPMPNSLEYFQKIINDKRFLTMVITQPPRTCEHAVADKRKWIKKYFPTFDLTNMIFTHKKYLIKGDVLFDDCNDHLYYWSLYNPNGITAKIQYLYNHNMPTDWIFNDVNTAWEEFYCKLNEQFK